MNSFITKTALSTLLLSLSNIAFSADTRASERSVNEVQEKLYNESTPNVPRQPEQPEATQKISGPRAKGLIIMGNSKDLVTSSLERYHGVFVNRDIDLPGNMDDFRSTLEPIFLDKPINEELLSQIRWGIIHYYDKYDRPFMFLLTPNQSLDEGVIQIVVVEAKLNSIKVKGNRFFSDKCFTNNVNAVPGERVRGRDLQNNLSWLNRSKFYHADILYQPGPIPGTTDVELIVKDRLPVRPYIGIDNTGIPQTGGYRIFAGLDYAFLYNQVVSYQYTTSPDFKKFHCHILDYTWQFAKPTYFNRRHHLSLYGGYARAAPNISQFSNIGRAYFASARYFILPRRTDGRAQSAGGIGFDFKRFNNNLVFAPAGFASLPVFNQNVNLTQFVLPFSWGEVYNKFNVSTDAYLYYSPGTWISDQTNEDYQKLRPFAKKNYIYGNMRAEIEYFLPWKMSLVAQLRGQINSQNLLPSEQQSFGGYSTIRGYEERIVLRDRGIITNFELWAPTIHFFSRNRDQLDFLAFFDYGLASDLHKVHHERESIWLMGIGPGMRYQYRTYLTVRFDWGFPLHVIKDFDVRGGRASHGYFSIILNY